MKKIDAFHKHESLDRTSLIVDMFYDYVEQSPYVQSDSILMASAKNITNLLHKFYQEIGNKIDAEETNSEGEDIVKT